MSPQRIRLWIAAALAAGALIQVSGLATTSPPRPRSRLAGPTLSPDIPSDLPKSPTHADAVRFAWQSFVAANWPALASSRGVPDRSKVIGQPGEVVWHTWKEPGEVFLPAGAAPPPWNEYGGSLPPECRSEGGSPGDFVLHRTSKVPGDIKNNAIELAKEVVGGTLTDQHGNLARYEIRLNESLFQQIVANQYYNVEGQDAASSISFAPGVMEAKASWREMTTDDTPAIRARYFRRSAWIYTPAFGTEPATCTQGEVGLVGLHITQKTPTRPQWTWATFEQVDNVPPFGSESPASVPYSFNNPACTTCVPNQSTEKNGVPTGIPTQVTRTVNIGPAAQKANGQWQALLGKVAGSPFQFYQLVDVQWPQHPAEPPTGDPVPGLLANTTMETYVAESSCLQCHFTARTASGKLSSDYTFVLAEAQATGKAAR